MNTRRSFFSRIAGMVAVVAIAPELAFRAKLALPEIEGNGLEYACNQNGIYAQLEECVHEFNIVERGDYWVMKML